MRTARIILWSAVIVVGIAASARGNATCSSILTADQLRELDHNLLWPDHPYSAHLSDASEGEGAQGTVKRLPKAQIEKLRGAIAHPFTGAVRTIQSQEQIALLKTWLKANPSAELPAWDATAGGSDAPPPLAWVPRDWVTRPADTFLNLVKESGNAGPIKATVLGAATSVGQLLGVTQHVAADSSGHDMFLWSYVYQATIAGRRLTTLLAICEVDLVAMSDDERDLRALEQQLARAWSTRDRSTVERLLARDWSVSTPDGATLSRAALVTATFESNGRIVEAMTTDDDSVTVTRFDTAAVVRGRTVATVFSAGARQTTTVRFTDFCVKRDGSWQVVASHQSNDQK